ncbi:hypothetical protein FDECE_15400 [Fusarium decemcellulare]|nr:hypothetical protein FDECE_15400 [Fusarium decemcellulare]
MHRFLCLLLLSAVHVCADTLFQRPPGPGPNRDYRDDPVYELGDEIDMIWEMDFKQASIVVWQQDVDKIFGDKSYYAEVIQNTRSTRYTWKVSYDGFSADHDPTLSNVYFFQLFDTAGKGTPITSHYFNITDPEAKSTTTSAASTSTSSTTKEASNTFEAQTVTETASEAASTSSSEDVDGEDGGLSPGAMAGIAVGSTIGGALALAGLGFLLWKVRRGRKASAFVPGSPDDDKEVVTVITTPVDSYPRHSYYEPYAQEPHQPQQPAQTQQVGGLHEAPA